MKLKSVGQNVVGKRKACLLILAILMTLLLITSSSSVIIFAIGPPPGKGNRRGPDIKVGAIFVHGNEELTQHLLLVELEWTVFAAVSVRNEGGTEETFTVNIRDITAEEFIGSEVVTLSSGDFERFPIEWTVGGEVGDHVLEAWVLPVAGETDTEDNYFRRSIEVTWGLTHIGANILGHTVTTKGKTLTLIVEVEVTDDLEGRVSGAGVFVSVDRIEPPGGGLAWGEYTDDQGVATCLVKFKIGGLWEFAVHGLNKEGCIYDPVLNGETSIPIDTDNLP